jgi:hypothetical protein
MSGTFIDTVGDFAIANKDRLLAQYHAGDVLPAPTPPTDAEIGAQYREAAAASEDPTYLLYFRSRDPQDPLPEFIILTQRDDFMDAYGDYTHHRCHKVVEIDEDLYELPLDRELVVRR